jgi:hypothetical protein
MNDLLIKTGFKFNKHGDALDRGDYRVFFDDNLAHVVKFNNPKSQLVEWKSSVDMNMGEEKAFMLIEVMTK